MQKAMWTTDSPHRSTNGGLNNEQGQPTKWFKFLQRRKNIFSGFKDFVLRDLDM